MPAYESAEVRAVVELYGALLDRSSWSRDVGEQLHLLAQRLEMGHRVRHPGALVELSNWHPALIGRTAEQIWSSRLAAQDYLLTLAREHGYADRAAMKRAADERPQPEFERCVEAVIDGDVGSLDSALTRAPKLIAARSHWGHRATLLHYVAANGVEDYRQRVPGNAAEVVRCLIVHGADVGARANMYGGDQTTLALLLTSAHPRCAGVSDELAELLRQ